MADRDFTVGDLRRQLAYCPDDTKLTFGGGLLSFYRVKNYADDEVNIEFNEPQGFLDEEFKRRNPHVKVVYINTDAVAWDEKGHLGSVDVSVS